MKKTFHIPVFVPHKGCPHDCVFCNQRKITGQIEDMTPDKAREIIEEHLSTIEKYNRREDYHAEIAFFGGSFTAIEISAQTELMKVAHSYVQSGRVDGVRCSTRPDCITEEILINAKKYSMTAIELGVQSASEEVLRLSNRGHTFEDVEKASELIKSMGIELGLQMMTGLVGDTYERSIETAKKIIALKPKNVRIYPTLVMEDTHLYTMYRRGEYRPETVDEALDLVSELVTMFEDAGVEILRIGLQTTDNVNADTVIGPYHPAFAELVYGRQQRRKMEEYIKSNNVGDTLIWQVPKGKVSQAVGHKKSNSLYLKEKYNIDLKVVEK